MVDNRKINLLSGVCAQVGLFFWLGCLSPHTLREMTLYVSSTPARRNGAFISGFLWNLNNALEFDKPNGPAMRNEDKTLTPERWRVQSPALYSLQGCRLVTEQPLSYLQLSSVAYSTSGYRQKPPPRSYWH